MVEAIDNQKIFLQILQSEDNQVCADCQDCNKKVTHVSVNNSVFLCADCANIHRTEMTALLTLIRPVESDFWSDEQIGIIKAGGGNKFFNDFMSQYDLGEPGTDILFKYNSMAGHYWRDKLHKIHNGMMPDDEMPSKDQG